MSKQSHHMLFKATNEYHLYRQRVYLESELSEMQRRKVEMLADKLLDMNVFELRYFSVQCKERI